MDTLALILVPAVLFVLVAALVLGSRRPVIDRPPGPWWGNPAVWVPLSAVLILVGVFVAPRLLGFTFVLLPLIWIRGLGRRGGDRGRGG